MFLGLLLQVNISYFSGFSEFRLILEILFHWESKTMNMLNVICYDDAHHSSTRTTTSRNYSKFFLRINNGIDREKLHKSCILYSLHIFPCLWLSYLCFSVTFENTQHVKIKRIWIEMKDRYIVLCSLMSTLTDTVHTIFPDDDFQ